MASRLRLDVLALCETHLADPERLAVWRMIVESSGRFVWHGRPAVQQSERGRGSGGVGLLIRQDWADHLTPLPPCDHPCLLFVRLDLPDCPFPIVLGVAYTVPLGCVRHGDNAALLTELEERVAQYQSAGSLTLIMGDFNTHIGTHPSVVLNGFASPGMHDSGPVGGDDESDLTLTRDSVDPERSALGIALLRRLDISGIVVLNGLSKVGDGIRAEATFSNNSVIDLILVDSDHWRSMDSVTVLHQARAEVNSDHQLISTHIRYQPADASPLVPRGCGDQFDDISFRISAIRYRVDGRGDPYWFERYRDSCDSLLPTVLQIWRERAECKESPPVERNCAELVCAIRQAAGDTIGERPPPADRPRPPRPSTDPRVREWQRQRLHIIRAQLDCAAASPRWSELAAEFKRVGDRMHRYRRTQVRERQTRAVRRMQLLGPLRMRERWVQLRQIGGMRKSRDSVPPTALNTQTKEVTEPAEVRSVWRDAWSRLAEHLPDDARYDKPFHDAVHQQVQEERSDLPLEQAVAAQARAAVLNATITADEVSASIRHLQSGKAVGCDGIAAEMIKNGGPMMEACLFRLITLVFEQGVVPADWLRGKVVPLHKGNDRREPLNYRPIALLSIVGKVYTSVLQKRLIDWCEAHGIIVLEQGGFWPGRGCPDQLFTLTELIKTRRLSGQQTLACFIDVGKAYDTVWHDGLKAKLLQYGIHGRMYHAICSLYAGCESTIHLGPRLGFSDFFPIETGVRQGCILSPLLYSLFINDLAVRLKQRADCGALLGDGSRLCVLLYADDIVLIAESESQLAALMAEVHRYSRLWRFEINHNKCGLMRFQPSGNVLPTSELRIGDRVVAWVSQYKYLGVELHAGVPFKQFWTRTEAKAKRAANAVSAMGMWSGKLPAPVGVQVYEAMVRPQLEYCCEVWSVRPWQVAETIQLSMGKRILKCSPHTPSEAVRGDLGWMSLDARYQQAR
ncbi:MAG: reverse transcriptase family protein, partial [Terracidiphilus sp.]|nr:reverse transcriptase family protein [Terracidiphilus sp.]